jgi:hypothetical protein
VPLWFCVADPYGSNGQAVGHGLPDPLSEEEHYKEQLRRMQRSMSPALVQPAPRGYDPRVSISFVPILPIFEKASASVNWFLVLLV